MDRRSWPWKKKSSEKAMTTAGSSTNSSGNQADQDGNNAVKYVQISAEKYAHLTELEEQVKIFQEKLSAVQTEMTNKDNLVKQHAKVAEEAVSGWEKAEAESSALKHQLESVTLLKLTAEERASHLDGALKECMKQIRNVKEESEQKLHDVVFAKTKQWEKVKAELEAKLDDFEQELLRASAENEAISRSLQEHSDILMKVTDEKMQADTEIEMLKNNILSCEKEINSLKYELHVISKELEIRNEEKNMSIKSADVANKQHLEDVKKISKLEAECQRLRGLVRKKLPGPAALAQMKLEVENLGRDHGETRLRRSPAKNPSPHYITPAPDFVSESIHTLQKDNEFLTARLLATEEETKMLKEALSKRNSELQVSRNMCAKTASKLRNVEVQMLALNRQKISSNPSFDISFDTNLSQNESNAPSLTSMSEDGIDEVESYSEPWATALMSELSQFKKEKDTEKHKNADKSNHLELMDDFLEMEKLACLSTESNGTITISDGVLDKMKTENADDNLLADVQKDGTSKEQQLASKKTKTLTYTNQKHSEVELAMNKLNSVLIKLQSKIVSTLKLQDQEVDIGRVLEDIRCIVQETQEELPQHSVSCVIEENYSIDASCHQKPCHDDMDETTDIGISSKQGNISCTDDKHDLGQETKNAICEIQDFVMSLGKESIEPQDRQSDVLGLSEKIQQFSSYVKDVLHNGKSLNDFILNLSCILSEAREMGFKMSFNTDNEWESNNSDCIDKVTLLENRVAQHEPRNENFSGRNMALSPSSHPDIEGPVSDNFEQRNTMQKLSLKEFEQMRLEKENMQIELSACTNLLEATKLRLLETEQNLAELKSQLAASQKSNSLSETQLKCMAESYKLLESRALELEAEVNLLRTEVQTLNNELQEERHIRQDELAKLRDLQEQLERKEKCSVCSDVDTDIKAKQEKEIAAAAEKLAECQETILLLGRQLQALRPPAEQSDSFPNNRHLMNDYLEDAPDPSGFNTQSMHNARHSVSETEGAAAIITPRTGGESPLDGYSSQISPDTEASPFPRSPINSKHQKHRSSRSSTSSFPVAVPEKQGRGFSRFFSKGKSDH